MRLNAVAILLVVGTSASVARADDNKTTCANAYVAAQTRRSEQRLVAARDQLRICARPECSTLMQGEMVRDCTDWLAQVESSIPSVVITAGDGSGAVFTHLTVAIDGTVVATELEGQAIDVDPGLHVFSFQAPNLPRVQQVVAVLEGKKNQVVVASLDTTRPPSAFAGEPTSTHVAPQRPSASLQLAPTQPPEQAPDLPESDRPRRASVSAWTYVAFGGGAVGIVVGSIFGVLALQTKSSLDAQCQQYACSRASTGDIGSLHTQSWTSNIGFGVGILGAGVGAVIVVTTARPTVSAGRSALKVTPWFGGTSGGVEGTFQ